MQEKVEIIRKSLEIISTLMIWAFGWATYYLYQVSKWANFKIVMFIINMICAGFVWYMLWKFIPDATAYRDWLIAIWGFSAFPILDFLEKQWPKNLLKMILKIFK